MLLRPTMLYDGACGFCRRWVDRWQVSTRGRVRLVPARVKRSVLLIEPNGRVTRGAHAVFRALATVPHLRPLLGAYRHVPLFAQASDAVYRSVARHRMASSRITRLLMGPDLRRPRFVLSRRVFFFALGLTSFAAFVSFGVQARGLVGAQGISPVADWMAFAAERLPGGWKRWLEWPSLFWLSSSDTMLVGICVAGALLSLLVAAQYAWGPVLIALWALYLSLIRSGSVFLAFQWDALLLETLLVASVWAPWWPRRKLLDGEPSNLARLLVLALLFKLYVMSGAVKVLSQSPTWRDLTALEYHYWTQPIPNALSPWFDRLSATLHATSAGFMYFAEFVAPFLLFGPRRVRHLGAAIIASLQVAIWATGNYGFFNALTLALCVPAVDDSVWRRFLSPLITPEPRAPGRGTWLRWPFVAAGLALVMTPFAMSLASDKVPAFLRRVQERLASFNSFNGYGLFAVMTTDRKEIELEGSRDGETWERYVFRYKPSLGDTTLPVLPLHMPRLDWQMWFAALSDCRRQPWFLALQKRLLEGASPALSALFEKDPFAGGPPPKYLRTPLYDMQFRRGAAGEGIWKGKEIGHYCPMLTLENGELRVIFLQ